MASPNSPSRLKGPPPPSEPPPCTSSSCPAPPPAPSAAPEGAVQLRHPSPPTAALLRGLQHAFAHARDRGLCPLAAVAYATANSAKRKAFVPQPHFTPGSGRQHCNCQLHSSDDSHHDADEVRQPDCQLGNSRTGDDINTLRKELSDMNECDKMKVCREKFMGRYKRSKALELEVNVKALFAAQYTPVRRQACGSARHEHGPHAERGELDDDRLLGCRHYARNCKLKAKCCGLFVSCRFCHDDAMAEDHEMDRFATDTILCMCCLTEQPVGPRCINCNVRFAHWYCKDCRFFENTPGKKVYHCNRCNICRLGEGLGIDNYHCNKCDACVSLESKERHICLSKALHANCPVCRGYLFTSTEPVVFMRCGHTMHTRCFRDYTSRSYQCPLCMHSLMDMKEHFQKIDEIVRSEPMPPEFKHKRSRILCNDCGNKCVAKYHFVYHKCDSDNCKSYNTMVLDVFEVKPSSIPSNREPQDSGQHMIESISALHGDDAGMLDILSGDCSVPASSGGASGPW